MATSISYSSTAAGGKTLSKSITDINPNVSNEVAKTFTQKLNALTTNTLNGINRIDKTEIDPDIVYSPVEAYWGDSSSSLPTGVTIDGLTINVDNKSITETVVISLSFRIKNVTNADIVFNEMIVKNITTDGIYGSYMISFMDGTYPRTQLDIQYLKNSSTESLTTALTIPGGSVTYQGTTYYYAPFTLTVNQLGQ